VKSIIAYPNPAVAVINFDFNFDKASHAQVFVRDITGKVVKAKNFGRTQTGVQKFTLDISGLANGMYTLEFDTDLQTATTKFSVSK
ncbi:MAG: T9SS type A sorting domain-containing protein, partial [Pedobacter sp.]